LQLRVLCFAVRQEKDFESIQIVKEAVKLSIHKLHNFEAENTSDKRPEAEST